MTITPERYAEIRAGVMRRRRERQMFAEMATVEPGEDNAQNPLIPTDQQEAILKALDAEFSTDGQSGTE